MNNDAVLEIADTSAHRAKMTKAQVQRSLNYFSLNIFQSIVIVLTVKQFMRLFLLCF